MQKITKRFVDNIKPNAEKTLKYWDTEMKGFGVVVLPSGRKTYIIQYRNQHCTKKRFKVGVHGQITTEEARALARKYLASVTHGKDPAEDKRQVRSLSTMQELAQDYLERHGQRKRPKSFKNDQQLLDTIILPSFKDKKIAHISRREIENLHLGLKDTPYQANRALSLLSKMFSLAEAWEWRSDNPVKGIERYPEEKRDRWLDKEELKRLWAVLNRYPTNITAYVFKLLLLTGARKGEALNATWDQFDLDRGVWTKPAHLTKQKKQEHLPLSTESVSVLHELKKFNTKDSPFLFPGRIEGQPLKEIKNFWRTVLRQADIENVRIHDLRHTYASHLVSNGLSLSIVGKLLGHTQASTTQRYAHLADEPLRDATNWFGGVVKQSENENNQAGPTNPRKDNAQSSVV